MAVAMATTSRGTCRGHDGMPPPTFHPNRCIDRRGVSNILQYGGRPPSRIWILLFWTTYEVNYAVQLHCQNLVLIRYSPPEILQFYNFASLAGKCLTTPSFGFSGGFEPLKIWVVIETPKRHILGWRPLDAHNCWPLPWQPHHDGQVVNMMGCDHPCFVPIGPSGGEVWNF